MRTRSTLCLLLIAIFLFALPTYSYNVEDDTKSLLLTEADFDQAVREHPFLLVNFHALWCKYSKQLKPEWLKLATQLQSETSQVTLAKVEAYDEKALAQRFKIEGYPTIKLFVNGQPVAYTGERWASHILEFLDRQTKERLGYASTLKEDVQDKLNEYEWIAILVGLDNDIEDSVINVASTIQDVLFLRTDKQEIIAKYGNPTDNQLVLVNNITNGYTIYNDTDYAFDKLSKFISENKFPAIPRFSKGTAERVFLSDEPSMILLKRNNDAGTEAEGAFIEANQNLAGKIFMTIANVDEETGLLLAQNIGIAENELPTVRIVRADDERIRLYYMDGENTAENIESFYDNYQQKTAKRYYRSEPVPTENNDLVKKVVTKTFREMVSENDKDVLLMIWTPWCSHCRAMMPVYDNVARKTRLIPDFTVAKIDASVNDLEGFGLDVVEYPTILFFTRDKKQDPIEFTDLRDEYKFDAFIRKYHSVDIALMKQPDPFNADEL